MNFISYGKSRTMRPVLFPTTMQLIQSALKLHDDLGQISFKQSPRNHCKKLMTPCPFDMVPCDTILSSEYSGYTRSTQDVYSFYSSFLLVLLKILTRSTQEYITESSLTPGAIILNLNRTRRVILNRTSVLVPLDSVRTLRRPITHSREVGPRLK